MSEFLTKNIFHDFLLQYDTFVIDVYKTIQDKSGNLIGNVQKNIDFLRENNKNVIIFTNYPLRNKLCFTSDSDTYFQKEGVKMYTSGEICYQILRQKFSKYFLIGTRLLDNLDLADIDEADFIYLDLPALPNNFIPDNTGIKISKYLDVTFSIKIDEFIPFLEKAAIKNKVMYSGKPSIKDFMDIEGNRVISNKQIVEAYRKLGGEVIEIGKPYLEAYKYVLPKKCGKVFCVGDTMETDILGADNLKENGYDAVSLLVLSGETQLDSLENYLYQPDFIIDSFGL